MSGILTPFNSGLYVANNLYNGLGGANNFSALGAAAFPPTALGAGGLGAGGLGAAGLGGMGGGGAGLQQGIQALAQGAKILADAFKKIGEAGGLKAAMMADAGSQDQGGGGEEESTAKWQEQGAQQV